MKRNQTDGINMQKPTNCCIDGCGRPTQSHNLAIDMSEHDVIGAPTLAGVVCHRCWIGETEGVEAVGEIEDYMELYRATDSGRMVILSVPVEELTGS